jgi:hypothetical protein
MRYGQAGAAPRKRENDADRVGCDTPALRVTAPALGVTIVEGHRPA